MMSKSLIDVIESEIDLSCDVTYDDDELLVGKLLSFKPSYLNAELFNIVLRIELQHDCLNKALKITHVKKVTVKDNQRVLGEYDVESLKLQSYEVNVKTFELIFMLSTMLDNK